PTVVFHEPPGHLPGWPAAVTTDAQGRFVLRGVGKGQGVGLRVSDDRFALQVLDFPPPDRDEEVTRVLAAARVLEGTVTDADTGKPVPHATVRVVPPGSPRDGDGGPPGSLSGTDDRGRRGMYELSLRTIYYSMLGGGVSEGDELPPLTVRTDGQGRF